MPEVLELDGVCRDFTSGVFRTHTVHAVDHVTFALEKGKTFGLVGNSGCGKTTVACAILQALKVRGISCVSYKCGPDYIDPMFHRQVLGIASRNLDLFFVPEQTARFLLQKSSRGRTLPSSRA